MAYRLSCSTLLALAASALTPACGDDAAQDAPDSGADVTENTDTGTGDATQLDAADVTVPDDSIDGSDIAADIADASDGSGAPTDSGPADVVADVPTFSEDPMEWALGVDGPYAVGFRQLTTQYMPPGEDTPREITVDVWYPASAATGGHPHYLGGTLFLDRTVWTDAPLAPSPWGDTYPVHVHSHGHQGFGATSADLMRHFASHGWIAVGPDHVGNLLNSNWDPMPAAMSYYRSLDISASLDMLESLEGSDPLAGVADTSRVIMSGHSRGVHTVWASIGATFDTAQIAERCESGALALCTESTVSTFEAGLLDVRIIAAIPMAGSIQADWYGDTGHSTVNVPVLAMSGTNDPVGADRQFDVTDGVSLTWIDIEGGCHQTFALGGCSTLANEVGYGIVNTYAMAFARHHLLGDDSDATAEILDGTAEVSPLVEFAHHE